MYTAEISSTTIIVRLGDIDARPQFHDALFEELLLLDLDSHLILAAPEHHLYLRLIDNYHTLLSTIRAVICTLTCMSMAGNSMSNSECYLPIWS